MPWYRVAYAPGVADDLAPVDKGMAQRLFDKTKWLASNAENLRHEPRDPELPGLSQYAVGEWRILYSLDREAHVLHVHGVGTRETLYQMPPARNPGAR